MPSCLHELVSALWIGVMGKYRLRYEDKAEDAEEQLQGLLHSLEKRDAVLDAQQELLLADVQAARHKNKARCKQKFIEYKRVVLQRERLHKYRDMVAAHMDALSNSELNKTLISTLQESAKTLKAMGVVDGVKQAELVVADVESSMAQVQELTQVLGQPIHVDYDAADWDAELEELLREEDPTPVAVVVPPTMQAMSAPATSERSSHSEGMRQRLG